MKETDKGWAAVALGSFQSFDDFVESGLRKTGVRNWIHFRPQCEYLFVPGRSRLLLDFLGYYENLQDDFRFVARRLSMTSDVALRHDNANNSGVKSDFRECYTDRTRRIVAEVYARDIETFGYEFENSSLQSQVGRRSR